MNGLPSLLKDSSATTSSRSHSSLKNSGMTSSSSSSIISSNTPSLVLVRKKKLLLLSSLDFICSSLAFPETTKFDVNKFILLQPLAALMPHYEKAKEIKKQSKKRFSRGLN